jgi:hypothetical protein
LNFQPTKKIIFVFLVLTLVSSVSTITFVTGNNNVNLAFAKKHNSISSSGGGDKSSGDKSSTDNTNIGTTMGGSGDSNSGSSDNSGGSAQLLTPATDNSNNPPAATKDNTPASPQKCPNGSAPASDGSCQSPTAFLAPTVDCNATPNDPSCTPSSTTTTKSISPAQQNFAPKLPPRLESPELQAHYNLPYDVIRVKQLPDGSCPADYSRNGNASDAGYCFITYHLKNPDGSCPAGNIMDKYGNCVKMPVFPGTSTGPSGGGFIQMFPISPPTNTNPLPPPSTK